MTGVSTPSAITVRVPFRIVKRGGRKEIQAPADVPVPRRTDNTLIKALARAFRWKRMLEAGRFATMAELGEHEKIATSYLTRVLRLTLLAPDVVDAILDGRQGPEVKLANLLDAFPLDWDEQRRCFDRGPSWPVADPTYCSPAFDTRR